MPNFICGPLPIVAALGVFIHPNETGKTKYSIPQDPKAWPSHSTIYYAFVNKVTSGESGKVQYEPLQPLYWQEDVVARAVATYAPHININLTRTENLEEADIRISLNGKGNWSAIGIDARRIDQGETMNLGFLSGEDSYWNGLTESDREACLNHTLHQFGHALGLAHEWNPAWATLRDGGNEGVKQHKTIFSSEKTSNFLSKSPDEKSIMRFFVTSQYIDDSKEIATTPLDGLSPNDKAWLNLIYPGKACGPDEDTGILHSLNVLEVPLKETSRILLASSVPEMRYHYQKRLAKEWGDKLGIHYVKESLSNMTPLDKAELKPKSHVLKGKVTGMTPLVDQNAEDDLYDSVAAAVLDPQFSHVLANVVRQSNSGGDHEIPLEGQQFIGPIIDTLENLGKSIGSIFGFGLPPGVVASAINPQVPEGAQQFWPLIGILGGMLLGSRGAPSGAASGLYTQGLPPHIEQSIMSIFGKLLKHPSTIGAIEGIIKGFTQPRPSEERKPRRDKAKSSRHRSPEHSDDSDDDE